MPSPAHAVAQIFVGHGCPLEWTRVPLPSLDPGEALVAIDLATVCGSDLHTVDGRRQEPTPAILGHEGVGRVAAVGAARRDVRVGHRVSWSIADSCGRCDFCTDYHLPEKCRQLFKYGHAGYGEGHGLHGTYASHVVLRPGTRTVIVPDELPDAVVAPANCALATAVNAVRHVPAGARAVLVQGAGLLGLYACAALADRGVGTVFCSDPVAARRALAARFGAVPVDAGPATADEVLAAAPDGVDAVLEMAGEAAVVPEGLRVLRTGGVYVFVGMVHPDTALPGVTGEQIVRKCLTLRGVHNYSPQHLEAGVDLLARTVGRYPYAELVSPPVPLSDLERAFEWSRQRRWLRVCVAPDGTEPS